MLQTVTSAADSEAVTTLGGSRSERLMSGRVVKVQLWKAPLAENRFVNISS